jgi:hypothetical protein
LLINIAKCYINVKVSFFDKLLSGLKRNKPRRLNQNGNGKFALAFSNTLLKYILYPLQPSLIIRLKTQNNHRSCIRCTHQAKPIHIFHAQPVDCNDIFELLCSGVRSEHDSRLLAAYCAIRVACCVRQVNQGALGSLVLLNISTRRAQNFQGQHNFGIALKSPLIGRFFWPVI